MRLHQSPWAASLRLAHPAVFVLCLVAAAAWAGDVGALTWGMPATEVARKYPKAIRQAQGDDVLFLMHGVTFAGRRATLGATVHRGQLDHVLLTFASARPDDLLDVAAELERVHGRPTGLTETSEGYPRYYWRLKRTYVVLELVKTETGAETPEGHARFELQLGYLDARPSKKNPQISKPAGAHK